MNSYMGLRFFLVYSPDSVKIIILNTPCEKWKLILDKGCNIGAIFMDLSKAFDTLNHKLLFVKLNAYGFSENAIACINSTCLIDIKEPT